MNLQRGEHQSKRLPSGLEVHLVRHPGADTWRIRSMDVSWGSPAIGSLTTKTWFAQPLGIAERDFDTPDDAYAFVEKHARVTPAGPAIQS